MDKIVSALDFAPKQDWRKSSYSGGNGACVVVGQNQDGQWAVADSKDLGGKPAFRISASAMTAFAGAAGAGLL